MPPRRWRHSSRRQGKTVAGRFGPDQTGVIEASITGYTGGGRLAIRDRLEFGNRQGDLRFVARFENGSTEYTKLKAQTSGTAVINLLFDAKNSVQITWQKITYSAVDIGEQDGILTVAGDCLPMDDNTNDVISAVAKCNVDGICQ